MPSPWIRPVSSLRRIAAALVVGFAIAAATHLASILSYYGGFFAASQTNSGGAPSIVPLSDYFLPLSLILFVLLAIAAALGAMRTWYWAALAGLVAGVIAAFGGSAYGTISAGTPMTSSIALAILQSLLTINLVFVLLAAVLTGIFGPRVWASFLGATAGIPKSIALVRQPSSKLEEGEVTHIERSKVDAQLADAQWDTYVQVLEAHGFELVDVPVADHLPDSVFVEDAVVVFGGTAVITSPGSELRRPETHDVIPVVAKLGLKTETIELPGTLDGGDVLQVGSTVYVGRGGRTNADGIRQLRTIIAPLGYDVVTVPVTKALHLKSAVTALPDGTIIGFPGVIDNTEIFDRFLAVPEANGAAVVALSADTVLMSSSAPESVKLIEDLGYHVITVDISEFEKLEGCVTCLSVRIP